MAYISTNPFSERQVAAFPEHTDAELDTILSLAEQTFRRDWRDRGFDGRKAILKKAASILRDRRDHFATLATTEMGKLFRDTGQACTGSKRFIVVESMADSFIARFRDALDRLMPGDPMNEKTTLGPLYSRQALETVLKQIESAVAGGAEVLLGGKRLDRSGYFLVPTLLSHVEPGNPVFHQEFFAPVAVVFRVKDEQAAIALANDSPYGQACRKPDRGGDGVHQLGAAVDSGAALRRREELRLRTGALRSRHRRVRQQEARADRLNPRQRCPASATATRRRARSAWRTA
jgi:acyl-CoA reductase-like NAD-dependent aldehyde dehydrogenase